MICEIEAIKHSLKVWQIDLSKPIRHRDRITRIIPVRDNNRKVSMDEIVYAVARYYNMNFALLHAPTRQRHILIPRSVAMYIMLRNNYTSSEIGRYFEKDHSTVINANNMITEQAKQDPDFAAILQTIENSLL